MCACMYCISGTFDSDFNLAISQFFFNHQTKLTTNTILSRLSTVKISLVILGQSAKLNVCQSVFVFKSPNLMPTKCSYFSYGIMICVCDFVCVCVLGVCVCVCVRTSVYMSLI